jgi:cellulose synthase/poly-beta-1,6-N-acetylglucosamine synthase-like glycosyltransferase
MIICAYNEEQSISRKLENTLEVDYPRDRLEIITFDNGSTDCTYEIAARYRKDRVKVYSLNEQNRGKSAGLNAALSLASGEIVAVTDVDCLLNRDVLLVSMPYFSDHSVGAVCGCQILRNPNENQITQIEGSLQDYYRFIRKAESNVDSTIIYNAEFMAFRKGLVSRIEEDVGADDTQIAIKIKESGHRALFLEKANFYEYAPSHWSARRTQKVRRSSQIIQAMLRYRYMMFKNRDAYSILIYPWNFFMHVISPLMFAGLLMMLVFILIIDPFRAGLALGVVALFAAVATIVTRVWLEKTTGGFVSTLLAFLDAQFSLLAGFLTLLVKKPYKWTPLQDTRRS